MANPWKRYQGGVAWDGLKRARQAAAKGTGEARTAANLEAIQVARDKALAPGSTVVVMVGQVERLEGPRMLFEPGPSDRAFWCIGRIWLPREEVTVEYRGAEAVVTMPEHVVRLAATGRRTGP